MITEFAPQKGVQQFISEAKKKIGLKRTWSPRDTASLIKLAGKFKMHEAILNSMNDFEEVVGTWGESKIEMERLEKEIDQARAEGRITE